MTDGFWNSLSVCLIDGRYGNGSDDREVGPHNMIVPARGIRLVESPKSYNTVPTSDEYQANATPTHHHQA